ncbi:uncharacterized protein LOC120841587 [Ixodes scapularis]|uniref:uncharacterized protein LOC120841587 n=1 Tax=Ixodes scapularis TaxID=6945 RepID=UPI001C38C58B|nr:uncharacterized protein LOC120841587 [Ixodes scapularis]
MADPAWQNVKYVASIPRLETKFSSSFSVCDLHFHDDDILKVFEFNVCGDVVAIPCDKWALKQDAVPHQFPSCPKYLFKPTRKRKAPTRRLYPAKSKRRKEQGERSIAAVQGESNAVLVSVEDTLKTAGEAHRSNKASSSNEIQARLLEMTFPCVTPDQMSDEHSYFRGSPNNSVAYYLSGYVGHKVSKRTECELCLHDISSATPVVGSDAYLTMYRSFKEGSLRHPSIKSLHFVRVLYESVSLSLDEEGICGCLFWKVLDELDKSSLTRLGCNQHKPTFMCQVLSLFIVTRRHFYARDVNRRLQILEKVSIAGRKARLL